MADKRNLTDDDVRALADAIHEPAPSPSQKMNSILRGAVGKSRAEREGPVRTRIFDGGKGASAAADAQAKAKALTKANAERDAARAERESAEAARDAARIERQEANA